MTMPIDDSGEGAFAAFAAANAALAEALSEYSDAETRGILESLDAETRAQTGREIERKP